jgi:anti-sigma factor RsiW
MKNTHILDILDEKTFADLSADDLKIIDAHAATCAECRRHFAAAKISSVLLKTTADEIFAPPPFFATRVMANLREKQIAVSPLATVNRMWKAAKIFVGAMTAAVVILLMMTIFAPDFNQVSISPSIDVFNNYSTEMVILNEKIQPGEPTNGQILQIVYGAEK